MSDFMFTVGKDKRKVPASQMSVKDLEYYRDNARVDSFKNAAAQELARRANGGAVQQAPRQAQPSRAIQPAAATSLANQGTDAVKLLAKQDPEAITKALRELEASFHLVTPTTSVDVLPEGFGVSVSYITVNPDDNWNGPGEVYKVGGGSNAKLGISGTVLARIGAAAGVDWSPAESGRLDDGSDPRYVHFRAVGYVKNFDGTPRAITGEVEIDLREGSDQVNEIVEKAKKRQARSDYNGKRDGGAGQLLEARKFILRHAERKAKNRAIADMGVKRAYTRQELETKPFAVARLMWTGQSADPELRKQFAIMGAERMLTSMSAAYGRRSALPTREVQQFVGHPPPPVGEVDEPLDSDGDALDALDALGEEYEGDVAPGDDEAESGAMPAANATPIPAAQGSVG